MNGKLQLPTDVESSQPKRAALLCLRFSPELFSKRTVFHYTQTQDLLHGAVKTGLKVREACRAVEREGEHAGKEKRLTWTVDGEWRQTRIERGRKRAFNCFFL